MLCVCVCWLFSLIRRRQIALLMDMNWMVSRCLAFHHNGMGRSEQKIWSSRRQHSQCSQPFDVNNSHAVFISFSILAIWIPVVVLIVTIILIIFSLLQMLTHELVIRFGLSEPRHFQTQYYCVHVCFSASIYFQYVSINWKKRQHCQYIFAYIFIIYANYEKCFVCGFQKELMDFIAVVAVSVDVVYIVSGSTISNYVVYFVF